MQVALAMTAILALAAPAARAATTPTQIYWEEQSWEPGGESARLTLWADGRSEITIHCIGDRGKPAAGWTREMGDRECIYRKADPYPKARVMRMFDEAIRAGIADVKTHPITYSDGSGTLIAIMRGGKETKTTVPMFLDAKHADAKGSANHRRYEAVRKILGDIPQTGYAVK